MALGSRAWRHVAAAAVLAAGSLAAGLPVGTAASAPQAAPAAPVVWGPCAPADISNVPPAEQFRFSCADYVVPLDHDRPRRGTINLALMRRAAGDQANRIGSLFLNPGGPGGSGYRLPTIGQLIFQQPVLDRFDLIGFDPRGVARSTPLRCFATQEDADAVLARMALLPITRQQERETLAALRDYGRFCADFAGPLLEEMSTEAVARDLDLLRAAVGDAQLNYLGFSYGTLLGATYVNLFPNRSRAIILDGNVDPHLRLHDGLEYDRQRTNGFEIALDGFLRRCAAAGPACAFSEGNPRAKFDELRDHLRRNGPLTLPDGTVVGIDVFVAEITGILYDLTALDDLAVVLQVLYDMIHPPAVARTGANLSQAVQSVLGNGKLGRLDVRPGLPDSPYTGDDSYGAVNCTDKPFTHRPNQVPSIADRFERAMPTFGRYLAWADPALCPNWPLRNRYVHSGPWNRRTPNPVLVYGNYYDPATQYEFARRMTRQLGNAMLVSADAFGHTILGFSTCTDNIATAYLIDLRLPGPGTVCHPNVPPFPTVARAGDAERST
ncbi:MAG TPA: alpha/beta hydrolase [Actinophytocola sp.]|uniref:alpha/beta hydrolase n=1 Tax=Actinophytocola sp. TaxID=1872138 RepID=UPI002DB80155|nr:alpha/beta hydrolase [Actinophytocola sp.]HEU5475232.1 alpha/beta hydrolase [Actinophytocola sp.]